MSEEPRGAIPKLIVFIVGLILGFWFAVPSEVDIGVMILEALAKAMQPLNVEQANQMVSMYIILFRILGVVLIVVDALGIYILFKRRQYF
jgi:hypothetical protein